MQMEYISLTFPESPYSKLVEVQYRDNGLFNFLCVRDHDMTIISATSKKYPLSSIFFCLAKLGTISCKLCFD